MDNTADIPSNHHPISNLPDVSLHIPRGRVSHTSDGSSPKPEPDNDAPNKRWHKALGRLNFILIGNHPPCVSRYTELTVTVLTAVTLLATVFDWPRIPIVDTIDKWRA